MIAPPASRSSRPAKRWSHGWGWALVLALAACQAPAPAAIPPVATAPADTAPAPAEPATAALPPEPASPGPAIPGPAIPEPVINDDPQQFMGIGPGPLGAILGEPELVRREAPAEIWQYRNDSCVLDVFLYDSAVTYVEARDTAAQRIEPRICLNTLLRARLVQPLS